MEVKANSGKICINSSGSRLKANSGKICINSSSYPKGHKGKSQINEIEKEILEF